MTRIARIALAVAFAAAAACGTSSTSAHNAAQGNTPQHTAAATYDPSIDPTAAMGGGPDGTTPLWWKVNPSHADCATLGYMVGLGQLAPEAVFGQQAPCHRAQ